MCVCVSQIEQAFKEQKEREEAQKRSLEEAKEKQCLLSCVLSGVF